MSKKIEERWSRWDKMMNEENYEELVLEFDKMIKNKEKLTFGDLMRRDDALESMGIISLSPNAVQKRKWQDERSKKGKPKS